MNFYKVVRISKGGAMRSVYVCSRASARYQFRKWTKPKVKGSKLFCWSSLKSALVFLDMSVRAFPHNKLKLFKCEVKNPIRTKRRVSACTELTGILWYWNHPAIKQQPSGYFLGGDSKPYVLADEIKITRQIKV